LELSCGLGAWEALLGKQHTSLAVIVRADQSIRGRTLYSSFGLGSMVSDTSSQSLQWRGKDAEEDLQALTAQVRKLRVRSFILLLGCSCGGM
jgi:hypothetical protein